jgi:hypothetical protein
MEENMEDMDSYQVNGNTQQMEENLTMDDDDDDDDDDIEQDTASCKCQDKLNKDLIQSLTSCTDAIGAISNCATPKKPAIATSNKLLTSCKCGKKVTQTLTQALKSCTDALSSSMGCTAGSSPPLTPPASCQEVFDRDPLSTSKYYDLVVNGKTVRAYCRIGSLCDVIGGWTQLGSFDINGKDKNCPSSLKLYTTSGIKHCGRPASGAGGCGSVTIPSNGVKYSKVCGKVLGYQRYSTDAFRQYPNPNKRPTIDQPYVDGVSITYGKPRKHVFTLASGLSELRVGDFVCPCNKGSIPNTNPPPYVGKDYYCESGNPSVRWKNVVYIDDKLWDGKKCQANEKGCCTSKLYPWFLRNLGVATKDNLELRVCTDQATGDENVSISEYSIFVN